MASRRKARPPALTAEEITLSRRLDQAAQYRRKAARRQEQERPRYEDERVWMSNEEWEASARR